MTSSARRRGLFAALTAALLAGFFSVSSPAPANAGITSTERAVISWINADREARGLRALRPWTTLYDIAEMRAKRMAAANVMSHTISGNLGSQLTGYGVRYYSKGENIAYTSRYTGRDAARHIYRMWKASSIHWAQMMSRKFNYVGVGLSYRSSNNRTFAALVFTESPDHTRPNAWITGSSTQRQRHHLDMARHGRSAPDAHLRLPRLRHPVPGRRRVVESRPEQHHRDDADGPGSRGWPHLLIEGARPGQGR